MAKEGSVISGLMDAFATSVSMALQYGVPLQVLVNKFAHMRFEPSGFTGNPNIRMAKSIVDYIFRWMALKFLPTEDQVKVGINNVEEKPANAMTLGAAPAKEEEKDIDATDTLDTDVAQTDLFKQSVETTVDAAKQEVDASVAHTMTFDNLSDAPACDTCGSITVRNGACFKCLNCGSTTGCS